MGKTVNFCKRKITFPVREFTINAVTPVTEMTYSIDIKSEKAIFGGK
ncbi:MAG: hypothetical protein Q8Q33_03545 [Chlamydiota bacterium]|nr:hypothetical protein [Chlamydiota bacterium]